MFSSSNGRGMDLVMAVEAHPGGGPDELEFDRGTLIRVSQEERGGHRWRGTTLFASPSKSGGFPSSCVRTAGELPTLGVAQAMFEYDAQGEGELSFREGAKIDIVHRDPEMCWHVGRLDGQLGVFALAFAQEMEDEQPRSNVVVALHKYEGSANEASDGKAELSFNEGDKITVLQRDDSGWWQGQLGNKIGWFPTTFVREQTDALPKPAENLAKPGALLTALHDFKGSSEGDELSFIQGDTISLIKTDISGWWQGELENGSVGWFPRTYVCQKTEFKKGLSPKPSTVVATSDYTGDSEIHELSFRKNDVIELLEQHASGWWLGRLNGMVGRFPMTYVAPAFSPFSTVAEEQTPSAPSPTDFGIMDAYYAPPGHNSNDPNIVRSPPVLQNWTVDQVCAHFQLLGATDEHLALIRREMVDGEVLSELSSEELMTSLKLPLGICTKHKKWLREN